MAITRVNHFTANPDSIEELKAFLKSLIPYISNSQGCLSCRVIQRSDEASEFIVLEEWESTEAHQNSVANFPKEDMQAAISLLAGPPNGHYYTD
jgi:quinol monooxygenase YgiN